MRSKSTIAAAMGVLAVAVAVVFAGSAGAARHGSTIVFSEQHRNEHGPSDPWLVLTHKAKKCPRSDFYNGRARCRHREIGIAVTVEVASGERFAVIRIRHLRRALPACHQR